MSMGTDLIARPPSVTSTTSARRQLPKTPASRVPPTPPQPLVPTPPTPSQQPSSTPDQNAPLEEATVDSPKPRKTSHHTGERIGDYILGRTLGQGSFAKVKLATHVYTKARVAAKIIYKSRIKDQYVKKNLYREGNILKKIEHERIAGVYEIIEDDVCYCMILELVNGGEVLDYIVTHDHLSERETRKYVQQMVHALDYLHAIGVCHRDLKAENLMLDDNMNIKIIDFGLSNEFDPTSFLKTRCGSLSYTSPELLIGKRYVGPEIDAWGIGVNMYVMLTGRLPFKGDNIIKLHAQMLEHKFSIPDRLSPECVDLLHKTLEVDPEKRWKTSQILKHAWFQGDGCDVGLVGHDRSAAGLLARKGVPREHVDMGVVERMAGEWALGPRDAIVDSVVAHRCDRFDGCYHLAVGKTRSLATAMRRDIASATKSTQVLRHQSDRDFAVYLNAPVVTKKKSKSTVTPQSLAKSKAAVESTQPTSHPAVAFHEDTVHVCVPVTEKSAREKSEKRSNRPPKRRSSDGADTRHKIPPSLADERGSPFSPMSHAIDQQARQRRKKYHDDDDDYSQAMSSDDDNASTEDSGKGRHSTRRRTKSLRESSDSKSRRKHALSKHLLDSDAAGARVPVIRRASSLKERLQDKVGPPPVVPVEPGKKLRRQSTGGSRDYLGSSNSLLAQRALRRDSSLEVLSVFSVDSFDTPPTPTSTAPFALPQIVSGTSGDPAAKPPAPPPAGPSSRSLVTPRSSNTTSVVPVPPPARRARALPPSPRPRPTPPKDNKKDVDAPSTATATTAAAAVAQTPPSSSSHRPTHVYEEGIRTMRMPMNSALISDRKPKDLLRSLRTILRQEDVQLAASSAAKYCLLCKFKGLQYEAEVCEILGLKMRGMRFKRLSGDVWAYKSHCQNIIDKLNQPSTLV